MATREQEAYLRELEEERSAPARVAAARRGRVMMMRSGGGLNVTVSRAAAQTSPVNTSPINFTATFSKTATGFANNDVSFAGSTVGGTLAAAVTGTNPYNIAVTGMTGVGMVRVTVVNAAATDATGTPFPASNTAEVCYDAVAPTVTINAAADQIDPTSTANIRFTVAFSEKVLGFTSSDVSLTGTTATGTIVAMVTGAGPIYTVSVTGMTGAGNVVASIPAAAATDLAGNPSQASTSTDNTVAFVLSGGGFPDATNTGSRIPEASLTHVVGDEFVSTANNQVISGLLIDAPNAHILIRHNNVTVRDCIIRNAGFFAIACDPSNNTIVAPIVEFCTIVGGNDTVNGIELECAQAQGGIIRFCKISHVENGIFVGSANQTINDNYIFDMEHPASTDPHIDGIQGFTATITGTVIQHNTISVGPLGTNSCITSNLGNGETLTIQNNLFTADPSVPPPPPVISSYGVHINNPIGSGVVTNTVICTGNHWQRTSLMFFPAIFEGVQNLTFTGNINDDTTSPITPDIGPPV